MSLAVWGSVECSRRGGNFGEGTEHGSGCGSNGVAVGGWKEVLCMDGGR